MAACAGEVAALHKPEGLTPPRPRGTIHDMAVLAVLLVLVVVGYLASLRLHPNRACRSCGGSGNHRGSIYKYSQRSCTSCGGNGRRGRLGVRVLHGRAHVWGERKPAETAAERSRNLGR